MWRGALAAAGFLALAPDGLSSLGGYPGNDDDGRTLQATLDRGKLRTVYSMRRADQENCSARYIQRGLGVLDSALGGGTSSFLAVALGDELGGGAGYGAAAETARVEDIKAALLIHYAETDPNINAHHGRPTRQP